MQPRRTVLTTALAGVSALLALTGLSAPSTAATPTTTTTTFTLDGVSVHAATNVRQVITVKHTSGVDARVTFWRKIGNQWVIRMQTSNGRTGYGGLVTGSKRHQGTGTTPLGTYRLISTFGTKARHATWALTYRQIGSHDYWVEDNGSAYYNRYRSSTAGGFRWWLPASNANSSEHLADYPTQYEMAVVIGFNYAHPVRHRGAGIFLHVNGSGATAGCVSAPRQFIRLTLDRLAPTFHPVIAIGR